MTRDLYPGEFVVAETPERLSIRVGETANDTAEAMLTALVQRYGVREAREALGDALRTLPRQPGGRRIEEAGPALDAVLRREFHARFRVLKAAGLSDFKAKAGAIADVAGRFSRKADPGGLDRTAATVSRRLRALVSGGNTRP